MRLTFLQTQVLSPQWLCCMFPLHLSKLRYQWCARWYWNLMPAHRHHPRNVCQTRNPLCGLAPPWIDSARANQGETCFCLVSSRIWNNSVYVIASKAKLRYKWNIIKLKWIISWLCPEGSGKEWNGWDVIASASGSSRLGLFHDVDCLELYKYGEHGILPSDSGVVGTDI